ncbi:MAG: transglycosylase domain-containing protein [Lewinellaceae bacterium]|nr:transglycosylase domain-containing protein [Lewinellaceae bacterium]
MKSQLNAAYFRKLVEPFRRKAAMLWGQVQAYYAPRPRWLVAVHIAAGTAILGFLSILTIAILVYTGALGPLPGYPELRGIQNYNASEVYADGGALLGKYYIENRINADFEEISPGLIDALVATEDARFFEHGGIDLRAALRVVVKSILLFDDSSGGGSTLSQQLAKNLYPRRDYAMLSMLVNKMREMMIARRLEKVYTKEELLNLYLNTVSFSENIYGIKVAAQRFFNKAPNKLSIEEAAVLVGMLKATTYYSPVRYPERATERRNVVLGQMARYGYLTEVERDSLQALPLEVKYYPEGNNQGLATYFREQLRLELEDLLKDYTKPDGTPYNLYTDGLRVYTTIDARLQQYAEEAMSTHMAKLQQAFDKEWRKGKPWGSDELVQRQVQESDRYKKLKQQGVSEEAIAGIFNTPVSMTVFTWDGGEEERELSPLDSVRYYLSILNAGFLAIDPSTGLIKAWVGGIGHKYFKYDHVFARRQVGSTFKPIVYATALQSGIMPCEYFYNRQAVYSKYDNWEPSNSDGKYGGVYSLEGALSHSVNTVAAELIMRTGIDSVRQLAKAMGVTSYVPKAPAIALGAVEASLYDMVTVYGTLANRGRRPELHYLDRIETADGEVLVSFSRPDPNRFPRVLEADQADMVIKMMEAVVDSGTARRLRYEFGLYNELAGKTGTTQNNSDGWFIGYNPKIVAGVWVGAEWPQVHFRSMSLGQGSNSALPVFGHFMRKVYRDGQFKSIRYARFVPPSDTVTALMQCPPYLEEMPILAGYQDGYYYFEDARSLLERLLNQPYTDENGRVINVPPRYPDETDEEYVQRILDYQQRLERRDERREKRKEFWNKLLFGKDKKEEPQEQQPQEQPSSGYKYFERSGDGG